MQAENVDIFAERRIRRGKTTRDHKAGQRQQNAANKGERVSWQQDSRASNASFPTHTCNGKKNRKSGT